MNTLGQERSQESILSFEVSYRTRAIASILTQSHLIRAIGRPAHQSTGDTWKRFFCIAVCYAMLSPLVLDQVLHHLPCQISLMVHCAVALLRTITPSDCVHEFPSQGVVTSRGDDQALVPFDTPSLRKCRWH